MIEATGGNSSGCFSFWWNR